jgi:hypothetical protein
VKSLLAVTVFSDCESETYGNRVNYCLVTLPAGRSLREYQSIRELLEALRDAIQGHTISLNLIENGIVVTDIYR